MRWTADGCARCSRCSSASRPRGCSTTCWACTGSRRKDRVVRRRPVRHARMMTEIDWDLVEESLNREGWAVLPGLMAARDCRAIAALYDGDAPFRGTVVMARHGFGRGAYKYFAYPLPDAVGALRTQLYPHLAPNANRWNAALKNDTRYSATHAAYLKQCHAAGQTRPTPLLLRYGAGDYNCLHQDLYGEQVFPLQVAVLLSRPGGDFTGGEFVLTEQRPRIQ